MATFINTTENEIEIPEQLKETINTISEYHAILYITKNNVIPSAFDFRDEKDIIVFTLQII